MTDPTFETRLSCTDRGTHPPRELALFTSTVRADRTTVLALMDGPMGSHNWNPNKAEWAATHERGRDGETIYRMVCPTCRRDVQKGWRAISEAVIKADAAGVKTLDVSYWG